MLKKPKDGHKVQKKKREGWGGGGFSSQLDNRNRTLREPMQNYTSTVQTLSGVGDGTKSVE